MLFSINRSYTWSVGFFNPAWKLTKGSKYDLVFVIDDGQPMTGVATAIRTVGVEMMLADSSALFTQFRRGRQLRVTAANQVFNFNLDGTAALLPALLECVRVELAGGSNPFAGRAAAPAPSSSTRAKNERRPDTANQAEATVILANVLSSAQLPGFSIKPAEEAAKFNASAVWTGPAGLAGMLNVLAGQQFNDPTLASGLIGSAAETCKGAFLSGSLPDLSQRKTVRVFTSCKEDSETLTTYFLAVLAPRAESTYL
jgi:hypothetical protein